MMVQPASCLLCHRVFDAAGLKTLRPCFLCFSQNERGVNNLIEQLPLLLEK